MFYSKGDHTHRIPLALHANNRKRLLAKLRKRQDVPDGSYVVLKGGKQGNLYSADVEPVFRQESYFMWTFGVTDADFLGAVNVDTGATILFAPYVPESYAVWMGTIHDEKYFEQRYQVDKVVFYKGDDDGIIAKTLKENGATKLLVLYGQNSDSGNFTEPATFNGIEQFTVDNRILHPEIAECRVIKTEEEIDVIAYTNKISSEAHKQLMLNVRSGWYEYQAESLFLHHCYSTGGMRHCSYTCIGATGCNCAVLHYGHAGEPNERKILPGDMALFDMGGEYYCYSSDITCSFPVDGKFTENQKAIYNAVYDANQAVFKAGKPGVSWLAMHNLAEKHVLKGLVQTGVLKSAHDHASVDEDELNEMVTSRLGAVFMPHGLGHFMGLDVHDVNGYPAGTERLADPGVRSLRTLRALETNMVLTIEPGCYFIDPVLNKAIDDPKLGKWISKERLQDFRGFGGVRIEDDVVVRENGIQNLTVVPRTVEEIEKFMATRPAANGHA